eukprot:m.21211 g.21211  ORF g.21211 m.21211 type:complete len:415 (+) comp8257_c0_seq1:485-1729(+)
MCIDKLIFARLFTTFHLDSATMHLHGPEPVGGGNTCSTSSTTTSTTTTKTSTSTTTSTSTSTRTMSSGDTPPMPILTPDTACCVCQTLPRLATHDIDESSHTGEGVGTHIDTLQPQDSCIAEDVLPHDTPASCCCSTATFKQPSQAEHEHLLHHTTHVNMHTAAHAAHTEMHALHAHIKPATPACHVPPTHTCCDVGVATSTDPALDQGQTPDQPKVQEGTANAKYDTTGSSDTALTVVVRHVSFCAKPPTVVAGTADPWGQEARLYRLDGRCWVFAAVDRCRFRRRIQQVGDVLSPVLSHKLDEMRQAPHRAATTIQRAWRSYQTRHHFSLRALNRDQSFFKPPKQRTVSVSSAEDGVSFLEWQACPALLCPPPAWTADAGYASEPSTRAKGKGKHAARVHRKARRSEGQAEF